MNPYSKLLEKVKKDPEFIDLTNTNFTSLMPQISLPDLQAEISSYFKDRSYNPQPKGLLTARKSRPERMAFSVTGKAS